MGAKLVRFLCNAPLCVSHTETFSFYDKLMERKKEMDLPYQPQGNFVEMRANCREEWNVLNWDACTWRVHLASTSRNHDHGSSNYFIPLEQKRSFEYHKRFSRKCAYHLRRLHRPTVMGRSGMMATVKVTIALQRSVTSHQLFLGLSKFFCNAVR